HQERRVIIRIIKKITPGEGECTVNKAILDWDATTLAEKILSGEVTVTEATETYIRQLKTVNPQLNVLVENRFAEALAEAKQCDDWLKEGKAQGRLFGVPIS